MLKKDIDIKTLQKLIEKLPDDFIVDKIEFGKVVTVYFHIDANYFLSEKPKYTIEDLMALIQEIDK